MKQKRAVGTLFSTLYISGFSLIVITNAGGTSSRPNAALRDRLMVGQQTLNLFI
jgi:hypothetical protein